MHELLNREDFEWVNKVAKKMKRSPLIINTDRCGADELCLVEDEADHIYIFGTYLNDDYTVIENKYVYDDIFDEVEVFKSEDLRQVYKEYLKARYGEIIEKAAREVVADGYFYETLRR